MHFLEERKQLKQELLQVTEKLGTFRKEKAWTDVRKGYYSLRILLAFVEKKTKKLESFNPFIIALT